MKRFFILIIVVGAVNHFVGPELRVPNIKSVVYPETEKAPSEGERLADLAHPPVTEASGFKDIDGTLPGIRVSELAAPGLFTIVVFDSPGCSACKRLHEVLRMLLIARPDVAVREVHMPAKWSRSWARMAYGLDMHGTPHVHLFDPDTLPIARDDGLERAGYRMLADWVDREFRLYHERRKKRE